MRQTRHVRLSLDDLQHWAAALPQGTRERLCPWHGDNGGPTAPLELYENWVRSVGWHVRSVAVASINVYDFVLVGEDAADPVPPIPRAQR